MVWLYHFEEKLRGRISVRSENIVYFQILTRKCVLATPPPPTSLSPHTSSHIHPPFPFPHTHVRPRPQVRGAAIIAARKLSSAASAANATVDHMRDWLLGTGAGEFVSMGVVSDGSYNTPKGVVRDKCRFFQRFLLLSSFFIHFYFFIISNVIFI